MRSSFLVTLAFLVAFVPNVAFAKEKHNPHPINGGWETISLPDGALD